MWARYVNTAIGVWLTAAPVVLGYADPARTNDHIVGPLVVAVSVIAMSEVTRGLRWLNVLFALWLIVAPWVLGYDDGWLIIHSSVLALVIWFVTAVRGTVTQQFGGGWSVLWRKNQEQRAGVD